MEITELIFISLSLAMDAFAVSICKGLSSDKSTINAMFICGLWFGIFQMIMPVFGYFVGNSFGPFIEKFGPFIAFLLISIIGLNMIRQSFNKNELYDNRSHSLNFSAMILLSLATSIDAFVIGVSFACIPVTAFSNNEYVNLIISASIIGFITFTLSMLGVKIGSKFGVLYKSSAELIGGVILTLIGIKVLLDYIII